MQMKNESNLNLDTALDITDLLGRRAAIVDLINTGVNLDSDLLEKALMTQDFIIIKAVVMHAINLGLKPSTECLNIIIEGHSKGSDQVVTRVGSAARSNSIYALKAQAIKYLIEAGTLVTVEVLQKAVNDEHNLGEHRLKLALSGKELEPISHMLQKEFNRVSEIRKNSRVLGQALRTGTSFFSELPNELLAKIASLTGNYPDFIEERKSDVEIAITHLAKPN